MFKVLMISYYYPPMGLSGVQRTLKFAKYLGKYNWRPTVITTGKTAYFAHDESLLKEAEAIDGDIVRTKANDPNSVLARMGTVTMPRESVRKLYSRISKTIFIPDNKKSWAEKAFAEAEKLLEKEKFDIIYVTIPPYSSFIYAAELKKKYDIPLFVDYRDLWLGNHFAFYPTPYHKYKHKKLEYQALKQADRIIVINRRLKEYLLTAYKFLSFDDIVIIPHGFDPADFEGKVPVKRSREKLKITYSGIFYESITPKYFLKAFKRLTVDRPDVAARIELHFVGYLKKENKALVKKLNLEEYIIDHGYVEHSEALQKIVDSDVLWMMVGSSFNKDTVSTGKLFEYFGARKPVIACLPEGAARSMVNEYKAAYITDPENIEEIKNTFIKVYEDYKSGNLPVPDEEFVNRFDREVLTEELAKNFQFFLKGEE